MKSNRQHSYDLSVTTSSLPFAATGHSELPLWVLSLPVGAHHPKKHINFSENWNGKLYCHFLTSIRLSSPYYAAGDFYMVQKNGEPLFRSVLHEKKAVKIDNIPPITARLDTGYDLPSTQLLLKRMYASKNIDWSKQLLDILLIENLEWSKV